jgi:hypothetical protein
MRSLLPVLGTLGRSTMSAAADCNSISKALMNISGDYWGHTASDDYRGLVRWTDERLRSGYKSSPTSTRAEVPQRIFRRLTKQPS